MLTYGGEAGVQAGEYLQNVSDTLHVDMMMMMTYGWVRHQSERKERWGWEMHTYMLFEEEKVGCGSDIPQVEIVDDFIHC